MTQRYRKKQVEVECVVCGTRFAYWGRNPNRKICDAERCHLEIGIQSARKQWHPTYEPVESADG